jgi:hypothetical protein
MTSARGFRTVVHTNPATSRKEGTDMKTIGAYEVRPGDIVVYHGEQHEVHHVDRKAGWAWPVASDGTGWAMALGDSVVVLDRAA